MKIPDVFPKPLTARQKKCKVKGCKEEFIYNGLCLKHFFREHRRQEKLAAKSNLIVGAAVA